MKKKKEIFKIVCDTREQRPFEFPDVETVRKTLKSGDYSIEGYENKIAVERKSITDLFGTVGKGRQRFIRELERLSKLDYAALVVESDWYGIFRTPPIRSKMSPKSIFGSLIAWSMRYNLHLHMCPNREFAEKATLRILERYFIDNVENIK